MGPLFALTCQARLAVQIQEESKKFAFDTGAGARGINVASKFYFMFYFMFYPIYPIYPGLMSDTLRPRCLKLFPCVCAPTTPLDRVWHGGNNLYILYLLEITGTAFTYFHHCTPDVQISDLSWIVLFQPFHIFGWV